jgi:predicted  nucleic acid-binding Zn-ribbon protein
VSDIKCNCAACGAKYRLPVEFAGRTARCKKCGEKFDVPKEKSLEDSVLDWLKETDEAEAEEVAEKPRVISMPKADSAADSSDPGKRRGSSPIRLKSGSGTPEAH